MYSFSLDSTAPEHLISAKTWPRAGLSLQMNEVKWPNQETGGSQGGGSGRLGWLSCKVPSFTKPQEPSLMSCSSPGGGLPHFLGTPLLLNTGKLLGAAQSITATVWCPRSWQPRSRSCLRRSVNKYLPSPLTVPRENTNQPQQALR